MKQHFLPQAYLREFLNKDKKLHTIDCFPLQYGRPVFDETRFPSEVCRSKDFYTLKPSFFVRNPEAIGLLPMYIEKSFHRYETEYPKLVTKFKSCQKEMSIDDAHLLVHILLDLKIRNDYYRNKMVPRALKEVLKYELSLLKKEIEQDNDGRFSSEVWEKFDSFSEKLQKEYIESKPYHAESHINNLVITRNRNNELHRKLAEHLPNYVWKVYTSSNKFVTTDNPGFSFGFDEVIYNTKFDSNVVVFFPLTPSMCLSVNTTKIDLHYYQQVKAKKQIFYEKATTDLINFINNSHKYHMSRYVFSNNETSIKEVVSSINHESGIKNKMAQKM